MRNGGELIEDHTNECQERSELVISLAASGH